MRTRHAKITTAAAVVAVAGLALAGCSSSGGTSGASSEKITLTFANADPAATWAKAIDGFEKKNPNITVKQLNIPYARYTSTINQRMGQPGAIDLLVVDAGGAIADFANRGYLVDLSDLKSEAVKAALSPDMVTAREVKGKLYAIEAWTGSQFLYYTRTSSRRPV